MPRPIVMPAMGMYTEEGVLTDWLRPAGTHVDAGDAIAEVTTEKTAFEIPAPAAGVLHPVASVGATLSVEALMGYILAEGEAAPVEEIAAVPNGPGPLKPPALLEKRTPIASPAARRLAMQRGIDLAEITGRGPGGRIIEADVLARIESGVEEHRIRHRVPMTGTRRTLAERLRASLSTAASTTLTREVDASGLLEARQLVAAETGAAPPYSALFIKLLAAALHERPELNAAVENDTIMVFDEIHIGFATAVSGSLVVPVVRNADSMPLQDIARVVHDLTERAHAGRLRPADIEGGTASITNLGNYGIDAFTPILNGPQSVILGIGRIAERAVVRDGAFTIGQACILSLTFDHRVADGIPAAQLLDAVVRRMTPESLMM